MFPNLMNTLSMSQENPSVAGLWCRWRQMYWNWLWHRDLNVVVLHHSVVLHMPYMQHSVSKHRLDLLIANETCTEIGI